MVSLNFGPLVLVIELKLNRLTGGIKLKNIIYVLALILVAGCATTKGPIKNNLAGVTVIERADNLERNPDWASPTKSSFDKENSKYFVGFVTVDGGSSVSAAFNMSDEKCLSEPFRIMANSFMDLNQVGEDLRDTVGSRAISVLRKDRAKMPGFEIIERYYERVSITNSNGLSKEELRVYSLGKVAISEYMNAQNNMNKTLNTSSELKTTLADMKSRQLAGEK
jgi:hypothetical protein